MTCLAALGAAWCPALADVEGKTGDLAWKLSAEARFRPEWREDLDLDSGVNDDSFKGFMRLRFGVGASWRNLAEAFVQIQDSRIAGEESSTSSNEQNTDLHQGWLRLPDLGMPGLSLTVGRQEWIYGEERLIGAFGWDNVGRSFDGARIRYERKISRVDGILARVTQRNALDPNGKALDETEGSDLYGVDALWRPAEGREYEGYWLGFADHIAAAGETGAMGETSIQAVGARMKDRYGAVDLNAEAAAQRGESNGDDLRAWAGAIQAGVTFGAEVKVRPFAGYDIATGDEDPNDGDREEFFNFFPTNHPHYGYADLEGWRNIRSPYAGASVRAGRHFALAKVHQFSLYEEAGPWKSASGSVLGFDPAGSSGSRVGNEIDLLYRLSFREKSLLEAGVSRFEPGRFARLTRGEDPSYWAYVMLVAGF